MRELPQRGETLAKLNRVTVVILVAFVGVALALAYWSVARANSILAREDNPRLVEAELRIQRGQILDRNGTVVAETLGPPDRLDRIYPLAHMGPAVGYYSFRHGTAGVEESFDAVLRGTSSSDAENARRQLLHLPQTGQDIQLTLNATKQQTADELLPDTPSALILLELGDAEAQIVALVSHPGYDPNLLDDEFDELTADVQAPLLNRVTQGQYQPGLVLQPFILAAAVEQGLVDMSAIMPNARQVVSHNGQRLECVMRPASGAWSAVLQNRCPAPMMTLGDQLGKSGLEQIFANFGFTQAPELPLNTETPESVPLQDPPQAGLGQDNLLVTPLQVALAWGALGTNGRLPIPQLVTAVQAANSEQLSRLAVTEIGETAVSPEAALTLRRNLAQTDGVLEHAVLVLSGPEGEMNAWYLGLAPAGAPRYALVIVVENSKNLDGIIEMGRQMLAAATE